MIVQSNCQYTVQRWIHILTCNYMYLILLKQDDIQVEIKHLNSRRVRQLRIKIIRMDSNQLVNFCI